MGQFVTREVNSSRYLVYVPEGKGPYYPILFLHGRGESGTDPSVHKGHSLGRAMSSHPEDWPFLAVFPQKPDVDLLWPHYRELLNQILQEVADEFPLDFRNSCLMGLSQGGNGVLNLADSLDWKFNKVVSMCGWGDPEFVSGQLKDKSAWLFHGEEDKVVFAEESVKVARYLEAKGQPCRLTLYPKVGHNCWDPALAEPALVAWLQEGA